MKGIAIILFRLKKKLFSCCYCSHYICVSLIQLFLFIEISIVVFENFNLDLDFKLINLNCLDFKSIDFRDHFKFNNFNEFRQIKILNLLKLSKYLDFNHSNPNLYMHKFCYPSTPLVYISERCLYVK